MTHEIPDDLLNSQIVHCINEYVRLERDREILKAHWFMGVSMASLAEKHELSVTAVQKIIHKNGDKVLLKASNMAGG